MLQDASIPMEFICPLTKSIMQYPVMDRNGSNFERRAILKWLETHGPTCPLTKAPLGLRDLVSNHALRQRIQEYCATRDGNVRIHHTQNPVKDDADDDITENENDDPCIPAVCSLPPRANGSCYQEYVQLRLEREQRQRKQLQALYQRREEQLQRRQEHLDRQEREHQQHIPVGVSKHENMDTLAASNNESWKLRNLSAASE